MTTTDTTAEQTTTSDRDYATTTGDSERGTAICSTCGESFLYLLYGIPGWNQPAPSRCAQCNDQLVDSVLIAEQMDNHRLRQHRIPWTRLCPQGYADTNVDLLPNPTAHAQVRSWLAMDPAQQGTGLGLVGETGGAKTRLSYLVLRHFWEQNLSCMAADHYLIAQLVKTRMFGHPDQRLAADDALDAMTKCRVFLFDDIGKGELNEHTDAEACRLIDLRIKHQRTLIWTANGSGRWLQNRLGLDRGPPTIRRLLHCWIIDTDTGEMKPPNPHWKPKSKPIAP